MIEDRFDLRGCNKKKYIYIFCATKVLCDILEQINCSYLFVAFTESTGAVLDFRR